MRKSRHGDVQADKPIGSIPKHWHKGVAHQRGSHNANARLNDARVREIRAASGEKHEVLAAIHGVSPTTIGRVQARKAWAHVA
jgi:hypothetical protein